MAFDVIIMASPVSCEPKRSPELLGTVNRGTSKGPGDSNWLTVREAPPFSQEAIAKMPEKVRFVYKMQSN